MTTMEITQNEVDSLANKMDQFGQGLDEREYALLLGLLRAARTTLTEQAGAPGEGDGESEGGGKFVLETHQEQLPALSTGVRQALPLEGDEVRGYSAFLPGSASAFQFFGGGLPVADGNSVSVQWSKSFFTAMPGGEPIMGR